MNAFILPSGLSQSFSSFVITLDSTVSIVDCDVETSFVSDDVVVLDD